MHRTQAQFTLAFLCAAATVAAAPHPFSGKKALEYTAEATALGPRPSGSPAIHTLQTRIEATLHRAGCTVTYDDFIANTPAGPIPMRNILCRFPGKSGRVIAITGHYDTKRLPHFVGANDAGSSTGFLMELANSLSGAQRIDDVLLVFFDGEEAIHDWTASDSVYGSRHLAGEWARTGYSAKVKALINVDMIGDRDLLLVDDQNSNQQLRTLVWDAAAKLGYGAHFSTQPTAMEDDHMPFVNTGVPSLDLIDFSYGPNNSYWHTPQDTADKLGAASFDVVGAVLLDSLRELEGRP